MWLKRWQVMWHLIFSNRHSLCCFQVRLAAHTVWPVTSVDCPGSCDSLVKSFDCPGSFDSFLTPYDCPWIREENCMTTMITQTWWQTQGHLVTWPWPLTSVTSPGTFSPGRAPSCGSVWPATIDTGRHPCREEKIPNHKNPQSINTHNSIYQVFLYMRGCYQMACNEFLL